MSKLFSSIPIDITPWNKEGNAALGLKRKQAQLFSRILILFSILLMLPDGTSDVINLFMAKYLIQWFSVSPHNALIITYTLIPWSIFILGIMIAPHSTEHLLNGYVNKLKEFLKKNFKNPIVVAISVLLGLYIFKLYEQILFAMI